MTENCKGDCRKKFIEEILEEMSDIKKNPKRRRKSEIDTSFLDKVLAPEAVIPKDMYSIFHYFDYDAGSVTNFRLRQRKFFLEEEKDMEDYIVNKIVYRSKSLSSIIIKAMRSTFTQQRKINDSSSVTVLVGSKDVKQYDFIKLYNSRDTEWLENIINGDKKIKAIVDNFEYKEYASLNDDEKIELIGNSDEIRNYLSKYNNTTKQKSSKRKSESDLELEKLKRIINREIGRDDKLADIVKREIERFMFEKRFFMLFDAYYILYEKYNHEAKRKAAFEFQEKYMDEIIDTSEFNFFYGGSRIDVAVQNLGNFKMIIGHNMDKNTDFIKNMVEGYTEIRDGHSLKTYWKHEGDKVNVLIVKGDHFFLYEKKYNHEEFISEPENKRKINVINYLRDVTSLSLHMASMSKRSNVASRRDNPLQYIIDRDRIIRLFDDKNYGEIARRLDTVYLEDVYTREERDYNKKIIMSNIKGLKERAEKDKILGKDYDKYPKAGVIDKDKPGHNAMHFTLTNGREVQFQTMWEHFNDKYGYGSHKFYDSSNKKIKNLLARIEKNYGKTVYSNMNELLDKIKIDSLTVYSKVMNRKPNDYKALATQMYASWQIWELDKALMRKDRTVNRPDVEKILSNAKYYFSKKYIKKEEILNYTEFLLSQGYILGPKKRVLKRYENMMINDFLPFMTRRLINRGGMTPEVVIGYRQILSKRFSEEQIDRIYKRV